MLLSPKAVKKNWGIVFSMSLNIIFLMYAIFLLPKKGLTSYLFGDRLLEKSQANSAPVKFSSYYLDRKSLFEIIPQSQNDIVFLGDSLIERCEWSELLENPNIKNRGIGGDSLYGLIKRIDQVTYTRPKKIFLMIGVNDAIANQRLEIIVEKYKMLLLDIKRSTPETQVFIQSVLPVNNRFKWTLDNRDIVLLNKELKTLAEEFNYEYIDLYSILSSNNQLSELYTNDGLHLNGYGYAVWKQTIKRYVD